MVKILLIRHGESEGNHYNKFIGHTDVNLQEKGIVQAKKTAQYVADNYEINKIYSSDLKRAYIPRQCIVVEKDLNFQTLLKI